MRGVILGGGAFHMFGTFGTKNREVSKKYVFFRINRYRKWQIRLHFSAGYGTV